MVLQTLIAVLSQSSPFSLPPSLKPLAVSFTTRCHLQLGDVISGRELPESALIFPGLRHALQDGSEIEYVLDTYSDGYNEKLCEDLEAIDPKSSPKTVSRRRSHNGGSQKNSTDSNRFEKKICVQCGWGGQMLVCAETGCPIAFHEKCLPSRPKFDGSGNYYCPYCTYKRAVEKAEMLRRKAMLAKQALLNFLDPREGDRVKKAQKEANINRKQASLSPLGNQNQGNAKVGDGFKKAQKDLMINGKHASPSLGNQNIGDANMGDGLKKAQKDGKIYEKQGSSPRRIQNQDNYGVAVQNDADNHQSTDRGHCYKGNLEDSAIPFKKYHDRAEDHIDQSAPCPCEHDEEILGSEEDVLEAGLEAVRQPLKEGSNASHEQMLLESGVDQEPSNAHQLSEKTVGQRKKQKRQHQTKSSTKADFPNLKERVNIRSENSEPDVKASHHISDNSSEGQHGRADPENVDSLEKVSSQSIIHARSLQTRRTNGVVTFANMKQKHLRWTKEEEEMLKEGVQRFSGSTNKNIPWRKILEIGSHVFDPARRPTDLKEKWKKIVAKGH